MSEKLICNDLAPKDEEIRRSLESINTHLQEFWKLRRFQVLKNLNLLEFDAEYFQDLYFESLAPDYFRKYEVYEESRNEHLELNPRVRECKDAYHAAYLVFQFVEDCLHDNSFEFKDRFHELFPLHAVNLESAIWSFHSVTRRLIQLSGNRSWENMVFVTLESAQSQFDSIETTIDSLLKILANRLDEVDPGMKRFLGLDTPTTRPTRFELHWNAKTKQGICKGNHFSLEDEHEAAIWFDHLVNANGFLTFSEVERDFESSTNVSRLNAKLKRIIAKDIVETPRNTGKGQRINPRYKVK